MAHQPTITAPAFTLGRRITDIIIGITIGFSSEGYFGHTGGDPGLFSMFFVERSTGLGRYMIVNTDMEVWEHHKRVWDLLGRYGVKLSAGR